MSGFDTLRPFGAEVSSWADAVAHSSQVRRVFSAFPAAVGVLCADVGGVPLGIVATSLAVGVSYDPPMALFAVRRESSTWPSLQRASRIGISILSEHQGMTCRQIASAHSADRFSGVGLVRTDSGGLFIDGAVTWMDCSIADSLRAGDHSIVTFLVHRVGHKTDARPLLFHNGGFPRIRFDDEAPEHHD